MAHRLKLIVAYDGRPFAGWQSQANRNAVQDHIEAAFSQITRTPLRVHGSGRTDAGVHALAQCAHVDVPSLKLTPEQWLAALNVSLPPTIRIIRCGYVAADFHARFAARGKVYRYRIWNDRVLPPLEFGRAWHVARELDVDAMKTEAKAFLGKHDFAPFGANRGHRENNTVRTISAVAIRRNGRCATLEFEGDGFLYKMVRMMVGALVQNGLGRAHPGTIAERLAMPRKNLLKQRVVAPAEGLFLVRVRY